MEEQDLGNGKEKRHSLRSVGSAAEAMQRVADRLIATTESLRTQFREKDGEAGTSKMSLPKSDGLWRPDTTTTSTEPSQAAAQLPQLPFTTGSSGGATSSRSSGSSPLLSEIDAPAAVSSSMPQVIEGHTLEPNVAHIDRVTSSESEDSANPHLTRPVPPFMADSAGQPRSAHAESPSVDPDTGTPKPSFFRASVSNLRGTPSAGTDRAFASSSERRCTLLSQISDGPPHFSLFREILFVTIICSSQLLLFAGFAQVLAPAQAIGESFPDTVPGYLSWYTAAYGLGAAAFALPAGRLGSLLGHKKVFAGGLVWFAAWSALAGASVYVQRGGSGTVFLCICRAMQGIGPAMTVPNGQAMLGSVYQLGRRRNLVMCLWGTSAPSGFVLGAVMASLFADLMSWEWAFFILGAVCLTLACQSILVLPADPPVDSDIRRQQFWRLVDFPGMVLWVSGVVLFVFAWNQAPVASWTTPYIYFLLIIGVLLLGAFLYVERSMQYPLLPVSAITPTTAFILACTATGWGSFSIWAFYTFQFLVVLRGWTPLLASAGFAHTPVVGLLASILVAYLLRRVTPYWVMLASMLFFALSAVLMATAPVEQTYWANSFLSILFMPLGLNMSSPVAAVLVANSLPVEQQGIAGGLVFTTIFASVSASLGIAGTVVSNVGGGVLGGYRGALYLAVGLAGLGILLGLVTTVCDTLWPAEPEEGAVLRIGGRKTEKQPAGQPVEQSLA